MRVLPERSLWDWAQEIAREHHESSVLVLVELLKAIERNELPATFPHVSSSKQHEFKVLKQDEFRALIEEIQENYSTLRPVIPYIRNWVAISGISLTRSDVESWLAHMTSPKPKPAGTANLPTGMPIVPSKASDVASYIARNISPKPKPAGTANLPTGMPGRPTKGKDIIANEFARRAAAGETLCSLDDEAEVLRNWYQNTYPDAQIPTKKTIVNNIRAAHRKWLSKQQQTSPTQRNGPKL